jgi:hypothetical protein
MTKKATIGIDSHTGNPPSLVSSSSHVQLSVTSVKMREELTADTFDVHMPLAGNSMIASIGSSRDDETGLHRKGRCDSGDGGDPCAGISPSTRSKRTENNARPIASIATQAIA